ncbi:MAG: hypothetical protein RLZZ312_29 [Bacteroidota bacterium]|jgi:hypothetical protein
MNVLSKLRKVQDFFESEKTLAIAFQISILILVFSLNLVSSS